jgi:1-acyl-sn-glycerol-3-phosphate acyltransferase
MPTQVGTAKMALEVADRTSGQFRVPIVPVGLAYTNASAAVFRGSALVEIGKPIGVTDELLALCGTAGTATVQYLRGAAPVVKEW